MTTLEKLYEVNLSARSVKRDEYRKMAMSMRHEDLSALYAIQRLQWEEAMVAIAKPEPVFLSASWSDNEKATTVLRHIGALHPLGCPSVGEVEYVARVLAENPSGALDILREHYFGSSHRIDKAQLAERERCAKIIEKIRDATPGPSGPEIRVMIDADLLIAEILKDQK